MNQRVIGPLQSVGLSDLALAGGKCATLGEVLQNLSALGIQIPGGFVITTDAYWQFLEQSEVETPIRETLDKIDFGNVESRRRTGLWVREWLSFSLP